MSAYKDLPLVAHPLNDAERGKLLLRLDDLLKFLGSPGDWGYDTKLGVITQTLIALRRDVINAERSADIAKRS